MSKRNSIKQFLGINKTSNEDKASNESRGKTSGTNGKDLPEGFAEEILKLEMDMDLNDKIDIKQLHRLIELYSLGVGHYESIGDTKYLYFHKKMNNLMMKPSVLESMNHSHQEKKDKIEKKAEVIENISLRQSSKSVQINFQATPNAQNLLSSISRDSQQTNVEAIQNNLVQEPQQKEEQQEQIQIQIVAEQNINKQKLMKKKTIEENIKMNIVYQMQESEEKSQSILKMFQLDNQRMKDMVKKQVGNQIDDIKKRLENRKNLANKALSLPLLTDSDSSLSDLDVVLPLYESDKQISSSNNLYGHKKSGEIILEDEFEDHITRDNSRRNSFDFQALRDGNLIMVEDLKKERNIDEIIAQRRKSTLQSKSRRSTGQNKLANKVCESNRIRSTSNQVSLSSLSKMLKQQKSIEDSQQENNDQ